MDNQKQRGSMFKATALPPPAQLAIHVVYTSERATRGALSWARKIVGNLNASIHVLVPQVVPYPLPLDCPAVPADFLKRRLLQSFGETESQIQICFCRDRADGLRPVLPPRSIVVLGAASRWWPFAEKRLAAQLRRDGHEVFFSYGADTHA